MEALACGGMAEHARVTTCSVQGLGRISSVTVAADGTIFACTDSAIYCLSDISCCPVRIAGHVTDEGCKDGRGNEARFRGPRGIAVDRDGKALLVADTGNDVVRRVLLAGSEAMVVSTIAGCAETAGFVDGVGQVARFNRPAGIVVDRKGIILVTDSLNHAVRMISPCDGRVTTLAGGAVGFEDGPGATARFNSPFGIALDKDGNAVVADVANHCIRLLARSASCVVISTIAGRGEVQGFCDGDCGDALFNNPRDVAVEGCDRILVADASNHRVRMVSHSRGGGIVTTVAGSGARGKVDGAGPAADFDRPWALSLGPRGRLLVACFHSFGCLRVVGVAFPWRLARVLYIGVLKARGDSELGESVTDSNPLLPRASTSSCPLALLPTEGGNGLVCPLLEKILGMLDCGFLPHLL